jgi:hypothetical protein
MDVRARKVGHPMPEVAAFMEKLRTVGDKTIDEAVRCGKAGEATFYACENGRSIRTASPSNENVWRVDADLRDRHYCPGCDGGCVGQGVGCQVWVQRKAGMENL